MTQEQIHHNTLMERKHLVICTYVMICDIDDIDISDYCMLMILCYVLAKASPQVCTENIA